MLAVVSKKGNDCIVRFERHLKHPVEEVWSYLTDNDKLAAWFPELRVDSLRKGGLIKFDMQDGTFEEMTILDLKHNAVLEYTWAADKVRFELTTEQNGCKLVLIETVQEITDHTPKDIAGWHVCLDVIEALLDGRTIESRKDEWSRWYEKYVQTFKQAASANE